MLGLGRNIKGVEDKPEQKAKRFKFKFFWDRNLKLGVGSYSRSAKLTYDVLHSWENKTWTERLKDGKIMEYQIIGNTSVRPRNPKPGSKAEECECTRRCRRRQGGSSGSSNSYGYSYEWSAPYDGNCKCHPC
jgi:hypothetical protein